MQPGVPVGFKTTVREVWTWVPPIAFLEDETVEGFLEERAAHEEDARSFRKADERLKAWVKARPEERLTVGRWILVKRRIANGVRAEVEELGE